MYCMEVCSRYHNKISEPLLLMSEISGLISFFHRYHSQILPPLRGLWEPNALLPAFCAAYPLGCCLVGPEIKLFKPHLFRVSTERSLP